MQWYLRTQSPGDKANFSGYFLISTWTILTFQMDYLTKTPSAANILEVKALIRKQRNVWTTVTHAGFTDNTGQICVTGRLEVIYMT